MNFENFDLIELYDSYAALRKLEEDSVVYFGNVDYVYSLLLPKNVLDFFAYSYSNDFEG